MSELKRSSTVAALPLKPIKSRNTNLSVANIVADKLTSYKLPSQREGNTLMYFPFDKTLHNPKWSLGE
jgi:hypothetical protein